jgi:hypothetical protein
MVRDQFSPPSGRKTNQLSSQIEGNAREKKVEQPSSLGKPKYQGDIRDCLPMPVTVKNF